MNEQFVTHEIALKLKELGFNDTCFGCWESNTEFHIPFTVGNDLDKPNQFNSIENCIAAPLWQQAIDWLIKKHDLLIRIDKVKKGWIWNWSNLGNWNYLYPEVQHTYKTYEECLKEAVLEAINIIIKNKNNG